ncbi:hypothetical protein DD744_00825 [Helicobacter pylori]|nr:hypothetical protein DD744_00825 [Helicobacter pylori]
MKNKLATLVSLKNSKIVKLTFYLPFSRGALNKSLKHSFLGFIFGLLAPYYSILVFKAIFLKTTAFLKSLDFKLFGFLLW